MAEGRMMATQLETRDWAPLLTQPQQRRRAEEIIVHIARLLAQTLSDGGPAEGPRAALGSTSVMGGLPALALLYAYRFAEGRDEAEAELAFEILDRSIDLLSRIESHPSLSSGFLGCAWVVEHVNSLFQTEDQSGEGDPEDPNEDVDEVLDEFLAKWRDELDIELLEGLAGIGVYYLERLPRPSAVYGLAQIVETLARRAEPTREGVAWRKPQAMQRPDVVREFPDGHYNLGLSHGIPGVIALLARICALEVPAPDAKSMLDGAVAFLLSQKAATQGSVYPWAAHPGKRPVAKGSRVAWCYGDLGIAAALMSAATLCRRRDWFEEALALAKGAAARRLDGSGVVDAMLCHGAAGNAHLFNRLYQASGEAALREAALYWYDTTFDYFDPSQAASGFLFMTPASRGPGSTTTRLVPVEGYGFLEGVTGVALALLAGLGSVEPNWDRLLLADVPPGKVQSLMRPAGAGNEMPNGDAALGVARLAT